MRLPRLRSRALRALGLVHVHLGDPVRAVAELGEALELARALQEPIVAPIVEVNALVNLALLHERSGRLDESVRGYDEARDKADAVEDLVASADAEMGLADVHLARGDTVAAERRYTAARRMALDIGHRIGAACARAGLARCAAADGERAALQTIEGAIAELQALGTIGIAASLHNELGRLHRARGDERRAVAEFVRAAELADRSGDARDARIARAGIDGAPPPQTAR